MTRCPKKIYGSAASCNYCHVWSYVLIDYLIRPPRQHDLEVEVVQPTTTMSPSFDMTCMTEIMENVVAGILSMSVQGKCTLSIPSTSWHINNGNGNHVTCDASQLTSIYPLPSPTEVVTSNGHIFPTSSSSSVASLSNILFVRNWWLILFQLAMLNLTRF